MNFLYCFDNNFNLQALNSIMSIINNNKDHKTKIFVFTMIQQVYKKLLKNT